MRNKNTFDRWCVPNIGDDIYINEGNFVHKRSLISHVACKTNIYFYTISLVITH